jgi:hypothetical protein
METGGELPGHDGAALQAQLIACIQESLAFYLVDNAIFLCERLVAQFPSEVGAQRPACSAPACGTPEPQAPLGQQDHVFLLATCYHRANQSYRAYHLLKGGC